MKINDHVFEVDLYGSQSYSGHNSNHVLLLLHHVHQIRGRETLNNELNNHMFTVPVYLRVRGGIPTNNSFNLVEGRDSKTPAIEFPATSSGSSKTFDFFERIFESNSTNQQIFKTLKRYIDAVLEGYNTTILAYGQTGSGKTFTLTGGKTFQERGLIPRAIERIWHASNVVECSVSYIEIHNEICHDLLLDNLDSSNDNNRNNRNNNKNNTSSPSPSPSSIPSHISSTIPNHSSFTQHIATNESDCLDLLFRGNMKRMTTETFMNSSSSRSHCIFTLFVATIDSETGDKRYAKLHMVDLAGSEDVYKSNRDMETLREGKAINLSLHYLEQVIVRLRDVKHHKPDEKKSRRPLPTYRNSQLTTYLRDSLGGNCRTLFLATINPEIQFIKESMGTCRFGERCSKIQAQEIQVNEVIDMHVVARKLEKEVAALRHQLEMVTGKDVVLLQQDINELDQFVDSFLRNMNDDVPTNEKIEKIEINNTSGILSTLDLCRAKKVMHILKKRFQALSKVYLRSKRIREEHIHDIKTLKDMLIDEKKEKMMIKEKMKLIILKHAKEQNRVVASSKRDQSIQTIRNPTTTTATTATTTATTSPDTIIIARKRRRITSPTREENISERRHVNVQESNTPTSSTRKSLVRKNSITSLTNRYNEMNLNDEEKEEIAKELVRISHESSSPPPRASILQNELLVDDDTEDNGGKSDNSDNSGNSVSRDVSIVDRNIKETKQLDAVTNSVVEKVVEKVVANNFDNNTKISIYHGGIFIKHGRKGKPHVRFVWVSKDQKYICWRKVGSSSEISRKLPVVTLLKVVAGRNCTNFQPGCFGYSSSVQPHAQDASFSLMFQENRTLCLEVDSEEIGLMKSIRNEWCNEFQKLITMRKNEKKDEDATIMPTTKTRTTTTTTAASPVIFTTKTKTTLASISSATAEGQ